MVPETSIGIPIRVISLVKARVLSKTVSICWLAYGRETSAEGLVGCCARRAIIIPRPERAELLVSTESDEPTLLPGTIVNMTYGTHKILYIKHF